MPFYVITNESYIKNNYYKFGYSSKNKEELLKQYEKNKRYIINPFIINWWDIKGSIKDEKEVHKILRKNINICCFNSEWYKCNNLIYLLFIINEQIDNTFNICNICLSNKEKKINLIKVEENNKNVFYKLKKNVKNYINILCLSKIKL